MTAVAVFAAAGVLDLLMPQPQVAEIRPGSAEREAPVSVSVGAVPGAPSETVDEAYVLDISPTGVTVVASTPQGVCRFMNAVGEVAGEVRLSERDAFYPPSGATAAELTLDAVAEIRFYEDPEPPARPVPDPNAVPYEDRPQSRPTDRWQREIDAVAGLEEACRELAVPEAGGRRVARVQPDGADKCVVTFSVPISDVQQIWTPDMTRPFAGRKWWLSKASAPQSSMPCAAYFNMAERNRFFFGAAALEWDCLLESKIDQELGVYHVRLTVSAGAGRRLRPFDVTIDRRDVSWTQAVGDWRDSLPYARGRYPEDAWKPAYCTWYAAHAAISGQWVERTAPIAADLGFATFILDDGWSYDEAKRVNPDTIKTWYRDVGRWDSFSTAKFPDFKKHREHMRSLGMNYIVWVAPYFLGTRSDAFRRWGYDRRRDVKVVEGNSLTDIEDRPMMESVTEQLVRLLRDCDLDGLKIDFIDYVPPSVETPHGARTLEYVSDLMERLRKVRPDGLFEFRQSYATPMTANLATQFRAEDVPFEWLDNLARMAQIRLTMGDGVPIHSDPIFWGESETKENVNRHFMAAMAGVPMLSMDLMDMSQEYRAVVRRWVRFYKDRVSQFHRHGKWRVFYRNGGLVGLVSVLEGKSFVIVNDPAGFGTLLSACGEGELTVCNVGFEPVTLTDGTVVAPADSYPVPTEDGIPIVNRD